MYIVVHMKNGDKILSYQQDESVHEKLAKSTSEYESIFLDNVIPLDDKPFREVARVFAEPWKIDFLELYSRDDKHNKGVLISREQIAAIQFIG